MGNIYDGSDDSLGWDQNVNTVSPQQLSSKTPESIDYENFDSPAWAPPANINPELRNEWMKLTKQQQNDILRLPDEQQESAIIAMLSSKTTESIDYENFDSPVWAPPANIKPELRGEWMKLTKQQQNDILRLPNEQQESAIIAMLSSPQQVAGFNGFYAPSFGDETLQRLFSNLTKEEQIELLKLSHERQLEKLKLMAKERQEELNTRIVIPKTASEEMYEGKLSLLAPIKETLTNTPEASTSNNINTNTSAVENNNNTASSDGIKKIITFN